MLAVGSLNPSDTKAIILSVMRYVKSEIDRETPLRLAAVDRGDPTYLHEQVAAEIRRAIANGEAAPGERIPHAKDIGAVLGVNTNTVLRALRLLRDEGLVEMGRGRAIRIAGTPDRSAVIEKVNELITFARDHGYRRDELAALIQSLPE